MEDLAASTMPHSHSASLYLLYDDLSGSTFPNHGLAPPVHDDDSFEFATAVARKQKGSSAAAALRACASDVSAASFADELLRAGALLPLSLPPRLQRRPGCYSAGASAAASPTTSLAGRKHTGFDPFAAALEKVRRDAGPAAAPRRARSVSPPLRAASSDASSSAAHKKKSGAVAARRARKSVRHLVCRVVMVAGAAVAPKALWPPRRKDGVAYRPGLLVCLGYGV